jgi:hypothetical protein
MYVKIFLAIIKLNRHYFSICLATILLSACNGLPNTIGKPIITNSSQTKNLSETKPVNSVLSPAEKPEPTPPIIEQATQSDTAVAAKTTGEGEQAVANINNTNLPLKEEVNEIDDSTEQQRDPEPTIASLEKPNEAQDIIALQSVITPIEPIKLDSLISKNMAELETLLGPPNFIIEEQKMRVWQYAAGECIFDFFLYLEQGNFIVTYTDFRAKILNQTIEKSLCEYALAHAQTP